MEQTWEVSLFIIGIVTSGSIGILCLITLIAEAGGKLAQRFAEFGFWAGVVGTVVSIIVFLPMSFYDWKIGEHEVKPSEVLEGEYATYVEFDDYPTIEFRSLEDTKRLNDSTFFYIEITRDAWGHKHFGDSVYYRFNNY